MEVVKSVFKWSAVAAAFSAVVLASVLVVVGVPKPPAITTDNLGRVSWLPLGGYVKFFGDENAASAPDKDQIHQPVLELFELGLQKGLEIFPLCLSKIYVLQ